jgi:hypothetical protein
MHAHLRLGAAVAAVLVGAGLAGGACAQSSAAQKGQQSAERCKAAGSPDEEKAAQATALLDCFSVDQSIPDTPGLMIVGLGSEDVVRPASPRALGMALANGVGQDGRPRAGLALDFAPYKLLMPTTSRGDYEASWLTRALWNTQLSLGVGKSTDSNDKSLRVGYGLYSVLWRPAASDPLRDNAHRACLSKALGEALPGQMPALGGKVIDVAGLDACYAALDQRTWNASALTLALAGSQVSASGQWGNAGDAGPGTRGAWLSLSYGFENFPASPLRQWAQLVLTWRSMLDERVPDPLDTSATALQSSTLAGLKLRLRASSMHYYVESSRVSARIEGRDDDNWRRLAVGLEYKLGANTWLVVALGGEGGRSAGANQQFVMTGVKFGSSTEPILGKR